MKDEYQQGEISLKYDYSDHFDPEFWYEDVWELGNYVNAAVSGSFQWKARFKELATGNVYDRNCSINGNGTKITFNIPNGLKNHAIYKLDLVVIYNPPVNAFTTVPDIESNTYASYKDVLVSGSSGGGGGSVLGGTESITTTQGNTSPQSAQLVPSQTKVITMASVSNQQMVAANYQLAQQADPGGMQDYANKYNGPNQMYQVSQNKGMLANPTGTGQPTGGVSIQRMNRKLLESTESSKAAEHNLFKFFFAFKDSKFNTKEQKLNTVHVLELPEDDVPVKNYSTLYPDVDVSTDVPFILLEFDENFDRYEIFGKKWGNNDYGGFIEPVYRLDYDYSVDYWLEGFMDDLYEMPDYDEWQELDVYDVNSLEPGGYPVEFGVEKPLPDWEDYLLGYDDWDSRRHENKWYPFGKRDFPTAFQMMNAIYGDPTLTFYRGAVKHGYVDWKGENVVLPDGLLSAEEVLGAMDAAPDPPSGDLEQFQSNVGFEPPTFGEPQYAAETQPGRLAIIDYTEWLTMRDYYLFKKHIHDMNVEILGSPNQYNTDYNEYYDLYFIPIESYLEFDMYYKNRPSGYYHFKLENDGYSYPVPELNIDGGYTNDY